MLTINEPPKAWAQLRWMHVSLQIKLGAAAESDPKKRTRARIPAPSGRDLCRYCKLLEVYVISEPCPVSPLQESRGRSWRGLGGAVPASGTGPVLELAHASLQASDGLLEDFGAAALVLLRVLAVALPAEPHTLVADGVRAVAFLQSITFGISSGSSRPSAGRGLWNFIAGFVLTSFRLLQFRQALPFGARVNVAGPG